MICRKQRIWNNGLLITLQPLTPRYSRDSDKWIRLPYLGKVSHSIARFLRRGGRTPAFYTLHTLRHYSLVKDKEEEAQKSGIYVISCGDCTAKYIGQTGRCLSDRLKEHIRAYEKRDPQESSFARHILETHHNIQKASIKLLHTATKDRVMNKLEEFEIYSALQDDDSVLLNCNQKRAF